MWRCQNAMPEALRMIATRLQKMQRAFAEGQKRFAVK